MNQKSETVWKNGAVQSSENLRVFSMKKRKTPIPISRWGSTMQTHAPLTRAQIGRSSNARVGSGRYDTSAIEFGKKIPELANHDVVIVAGCRLDDIGRGTERVGAADVTGFVR
jgi:hypothetical protein